MANSVTRKSFILVVDNDNKESINHDFKLNDKNVTSPRSFEKKDISKESSLKSDNNVDIKDRNLSQDQKEDTKTEQLFQLLVGFEMADNPSEKEKVKAVQALIEYFSTADRLLQEEDIEGNNAFHWAAKLNSFEAWEAFCELLDKKKVPLSLRNHFGETAKDLIFKSPNLDFVKSVLLDELKRKPKFPLINDLIKQYYSNIKDCKTFADKKKLIHRYIQHRAFLAGDQVVIQNTVNESHRQWEREQKETLEIECFMRKPAYLSIAQTILSGGNYEAIHYLNKFSNRCSLKELLQDSHADQPGVESCIVAIFKQKYWYRIFEGLGYPPQEITTLAEKYVFAIAKSGALGNVLMQLVDKCRYDFDQIAKFLSITDTDGQTPLHYSAQYGHLGADLVELTKIGFSKDQIAKFLSITDTNGVTPLHIAANKAHLGAYLVTLHKIGFSDEIITKLLSITDGCYYTPFHYSAENGTLGADLVALKQIGFSDEIITKLLSIANTEGDTPLHITAYKGHLGADLVTLNKRGFSKDQITKFLSITSTYGVTPLNTAARYDRLGASLVTLHKGGFSKEQIITLLSIADKYYTTPLFGKEYDKELTKALQSAGLEKSDIKPLYDLQCSNPFQLLLSLWSILSLRAKAQFFFFAFILLLVAYYLKPFSKSK